MAFQIRSKRHSEAMAEINVIPLVDVMLVLLIIFMITAPFMKPQSATIKVDLPSTDGQPSPLQKEDIVLTLSKNGELFFAQEKNPYTLSTLPEKLSGAFKDQADKKIVLSADKTVSWDLVAQVMAVCQKSGIEKIGFSTDVKSPAK